jgi:hypothetical protein
VKDTALESGLLKMKISEIISGNQSVYESPLKKRERSINPYDDEGEELKLK